MSVVDREPACGIDDQHVGERSARLRKCARGDRDRRFVDAARNEQRTHFLCQRFELFDRGRAIYVGADNGHFFLLPLDEQPGELGHGRRLTRTLQAGHQHYRRRRRGQIESVVGCAHQFDQLVVDELHERLTRRQTLRDRSTQGADADVLDEILHD